MQFDDVVLTEKFTRNEMEHEKMMEYLAKDKRTIENLTENVIKMSGSITELVTTQKMILSRKPFFETKTGRIVLIFSGLLVAGLFYVAFRVNLFHLYDAGKIISGGG